MHNLQSSTLVPPQHPSPKQNSLNFVNVAKSDKDCIDDDRPGGTEPGENLVQCNVSSQLGASIFQLFFCFCFFENLVQCNVSWQVEASIFQLFSHQALCAVQERHGYEQCYRKQETVVAPKRT